MSTLMREIDNSDSHEFIDIDANLDTEDGNPDNVLLDNFQNESQNSDDEEHETEIPKIDDYEKRIVSYKDSLLEIKKLKQFCSEKTIYKRMVCLVSYHYILKQNWGVIHSSKLPF
ncbi:hypothetical protein QE152_g23413 [Popillia japonica]|uniref:Uncharacterized protein n=1 Tax=Popillia japonica TaxID=7064 RepID=A0AAW1KFG4_POPJA